MLHRYTVLRNEQAKDIGGRRTKRSRVHFRLVATETNGGLTEAEHFAEPYNDSTR